MFVIQDMWGVDIGRSLVEGKSGKKVIETTSQLASCAWWLVLVILAMWEA
jgi:hypothetical protein